MKYGLKFKISKSFCQINVMIFIKIIFYNNKSEYFLFQK